MELTSLQVLTQSLRKTSREITIIPLSSVLPLFIHCVSEKVSTFKLSVTLSNRTNFQNFCTAEKLVKFATKPTQHHPPHLRHVATLPSHIKIQIFCKNSADMETMRTNCIFSAQILIPLRP